MLQSQVEEGYSLSSTAGILGNSRSEETTRLRINKAEGCGQDPTGSLNQSTANLKPLITCLNGSTEMLLETERQMLILARPWI